MNRRGFLGTLGALPLIGMAKADATDYNDTKCAQCGGVWSDCSCTTLPDAPNPFADALNASKVEPGFCGGPHIECTSPTSWRYNREDKTASIGWTYAGFELSDKHDSPNKDVIKSQVGDGTLTWAWRWTKELSRVTAIVMKRHNIEWADTLVDGETGQLKYVLRTTGARDVRWDFGKKLWVNQVW